MEVKPCLAKKYDCIGYDNCVLPVNMLTSIFKYFSPKTLTKCTSVCKEWRRVASKNILWENLFKTRFPQTYKTIAYNSKISFKEMYRHYFLADSYLLEKQFSNNCRKINFHPVFNLKNFNGQLAEKVINLDPNLVRIYENKIYVGKDRKIEIMDEFSTQIVEIEFKDSIQKTHELISMAIDKVKGHLYMRFCDPSRLHEDCISIINMKDWNCIKSFNVGRGNYYAVKEHKKLQGDDFFPELYNIRIQDKWLVVASNMKLQIWNIEDDKFIEGLILTESITSFKLHDNKIFYSCGGDICVWDLEKNGHFDGRRFTQTEDRTLKYIQIHDGKLFAGYTVEAATRAYACESNYGVIVFDLVSQKKIVQFRNEGLLLAMLYTGDKLLTMTKVDLQAKRELITRNFEPPAVPKISKNKALTEVTSKKRKREEFSQIENAL